MKRGTWLTSEEYLEIQHQIPDSVGGDARAKAYYKLREKIDERHMRWQKRINQANPRQVVNLICKELKLPKEVEISASELVTNATQKTTRRRSRGARPSLVGMAAAAVSIISPKYGLVISERELAEVAVISEMCIRNNIRKMTGGLVYRQIAFTEEMERFRRLGWKVNVTTKGYKGRCAILDLGQYRVVKVTGDEEFVGRIIDAVKGQIGAGGSP